MDQKGPDQNRTDREKPLSIWFIVFFIPLYIGGIFSLLIFAISGDWGWDRGWLFLVSFVLILTIGYYLINRKNPEVLRNRMKVKKEGLTAATRKPAGSDWFIFPMMGASFFGAMILTSLNHRFGWSSVPFGISVFFLLLSCGGNILILLAMYQNAYASKILDISQGQHLIDTGLYSKVRHPLYSGALLMILAYPLALGSLWGLVPAVFAALSLILRIRFEEKMLVLGLEGYLEYQKRVPYKVIPGIY